MSILNHKEFSFEIGDEIVYPMHGAGVIESIEEKEIHGQEQSYYILRLIEHTMRVMIPVNSTDDAGLRYVVDGKIAEEVLDEFKDYIVDSNPNWNKRYRENMLKLKTGDIVEVAKVVKGLMIREKERGLSTGERKMLSSARLILSSELSLVLKNNIKDVETALTSSLCEVG